MHSGSFSRQALFWLLVLSVLPIALNRPFLWAGYFFLVSIVAAYSVSRSFCDYSILSRLIHSYPALVVALFAWFSWCISGNYLFSEMGAVQASESMLLCLGYGVLFIGACCFTRGVAGVRAIYMGLVAIFSAQVVAMVVELLLMDQFAFEFSGTFVNPNHFGVFAVALGAFLYAFGQPELLFRRDIGGMRAWPLVEWSISNVRGMVVFCGLMALASGSRGAIVVLVIALFSAWLVRRGAYSVVWLQVIGLVALAMVLSVLALGFFPVTNFLHADRIVVWREVFEQFPLYGFLGVGGAGFERFFAEIKPLSLSSVTYDHAHSDYIEILVEQGAIGLGLFAATLFAWFFTLSRILRDAAIDAVWRRVVVGYFVGVSAVFMQAAFDFPLSLPGVPAFLLIVSAQVLCVFSERRNAIDVS